MAFSMMANPNIFYKHSDLFSKFIRTNRLDALLYKKDEIYKYYEKLK